MALQTAIDLSPVPNRQQMNLIMLHVEGVNDAIIALIAFFMPARRAARINPVQALRT